MRTLGLVAVFAAACGTNDPGWSEARTFDFGPFDIAPSQEISDQCVQITLHNDTDIYINTVDLATGPGFHHSNWFFVPADNPATGALSPFPGDDGQFTCADRHFDQAVAALKGGVLFAQSTQAQQERQQFPAGVAVKIPAGSKLLSTIHLLNAGDTKLHVTPKITLTPIAQPTVTTLLAGMSFEDHALALPPKQRSRFTLDCDLDPTHQTPAASWPAPNYKFYYALAHYHTLGTGMTIEGVRGDGSTATIYSTATLAGDGLGGPIDPLFDMTGFARLTLSCDYYNNTDAVVGWGIGTQEMCVFLAFTDSPYYFGGGAVDENSPAGDPTDVNGVMTYSHPCKVFGVDATH